MSHAGGISITMAVLCAAVVAGGESGTLTGRVTFDGPLPEVFKFDLGAAPSDLAVCSGGKEALRPSKRLTVDETTKGVANVVVRLTSQDGKTPQPSKSFPAKRRPTIDQVACEFLPFVEWVEAGQSLRITSSDDTMHNIHAYREKKGGETIFNEAMPRKGQTISKRLDDPGLVVLYCDAGHIWMNASVFVVDNPYVEITAKDGAFKMEGIPLGRCRVSLWQAGWTVTAGGNDAKTGKPTWYAYSEPLVLDLPVEIKAGENKLDTALTKDGWRK